MRAIYRIFVSWCLRNFTQTEVNIKDFEKLESKKYLQSEKQREIDQEAKKLNSPMGPYGGF